MKKCCNQAKFQLNKSFLRVTPAKDTAGLAECYIRTLDISACSDFLYVDVALDYSTCNIVIHLCRI